MKKTLLLILSLCLLTSCAVRQPADTETTDENTRETAQAASEGDSGEELQFWFPDSSELRFTAEDAPLEKLHAAACEVFGEALDEGVEDVTVKLLFDENGECSVLSDGGFSEQTEEFIRGSSLVSGYVEVSLDSRFADGVGLALAEAENEHDIPADMPNSFNFADGTFDGDLSEIRTFPTLTEGRSLAEYEFNNMTACIEELNGYAAAGAQAAWSVFAEMSGYYDEWYIERYGTAHTVLCSDENGEWSVDSAAILTEECAQQIAQRFSADNVLSQAENCTVQLMFYMEKFVGVSANYSADEKFFATYDVEFWQPYKAPYEGSYDDKSFLYWYGTDGCLKAQNGRLCPVGTYCIETGEPLGVYVAPSVMGDWRPVTVGGEEFVQYAAEMSDGWTDYTQIVFRISESQLFIYNIGSISLYDLVKTDNGFDVEYHGQKHGSLTIDGGEVTLYLRHRFTNNDMNMPMVLERTATPETNTKSPVKQEILSAAEHAALDTQEYGLLDLSGERIMGQEIPDPGVLSWWRDYAANGGAYTMETYRVGAMRLEYDLYSTDGVNGYSRWDLIEHDEPSEPRHGYEYVYFPDTVYHSSFTIDRYDLRKFDRWDNTEGDKVCCPLFWVSDNPLHFVKAYTITIGGVEYVAEEWQMGDLNNGYIVYSIDGFIKGYEGQFYGDPVTYTVTRLEMEGDESLIVRPERLSGTVYNNNEE